MRYRRPGRHVLAAEALLLLSWTVLPAAEFATNLDGVGEFAINPEPNPLASPARNPRRASKV